MIFFTAKNTSGSPVWSVISFLERGDHFTPRQAKLRNGKCFTSDLSNLPDWLVEFLRSAPVWPGMSVGIEGRNPPKPSMIPASMSLSVILKLGKVITPKTDFVTLAFFTKGKICKGEPSAMLMRQMHCWKFRMESMP